MAIKHALVVAAAAAVVGTQVFAQDPSPTVVLVHGAFADGSAWNRVVPILQDSGLNTIAVQLPLTSLEEDVAFTARAINEADGDVILVGHSWGGAVITQAGVDEDVSALVYLSAFALQEGQHVHDIQEIGHGEKGIAHVPGLASPIVDGQGFIRLAEDDIIAYFAPDIPRNEAELIAASQGRIHASVLDHAPTAQAWENLPSHYIVTTQDQMIAPDLQRLMAEQIGADVVELDASHASMLSQPEAVAAIILRAAEN